jgi:hypothetical protein
MPAARGKEAKAARRHLTVHRAAIAAVFVACVVGIVVLQLTSVASTPIVAEVRTRGVLFVPKSEASLVLSHVTSVLPGDDHHLLANIGDGRVRNGGTKAHGGGAPIRAHAQFPVVITGSALRISGTDLATRLQMAKGSAIEIRPDGAPAPTVTVRLGAASRVTLTTGEAVEVHCRNCELRQQQTNLMHRGERFILHPSPREVSVNGAGRGVDVGLTLPGPVTSGDYGADRHFPVTSIDFTESAPGRLDSLVVEGTVHLPEAAKKDVKVREGEMIVLRGDLVVSGLRIGPELTLRLEGDVSVLDTGAEPSSMRSLKPSRLEWIIANEPRKAVFGAIVATFGFVMAAAGRLKIGGTQ